MGAQLPALARDEFSHLNAHLFSRPGVAVHLEDGRNFLLRSRTAYDVIQIEITSLWFAGATNLYSREFYALARSRLAPGGALLQWVQLHHLGPREIATVLATARAEFPHVALWRAGGQACLVATIDPPRPNVALWQAWLAEPGLAAERAATGLVSPEALAETELLTPPRLDALLARHAGAYGLNTDRNRWLEFHSPKYYLSRADHQAANLRWIDSARSAQTPAP